MYIGWPGSHTHVTLGLTGKISKSEMWGSYMTFQLSQWVIRLWIRNNGLCYCK